MNQEVEEIKQQIRDMIAGAKGDYWRRIHADIQVAIDFAESLSSAIGEVSADVVHDAWRRDLVKKLIAANE